MATYAIGADVCPVAPPPDAFGWGTPRHAGSRPPSDPLHGDSDTVLDVCRHCGADLDGIRVAPGGPRTYLTRIFI